MSAGTKNIAMRERSGSINSNSKLVSFLYLLMRDHLPAGVIEEIIRDAEETTDCQFTNGWLAKYAEDLKDRLK